MSNDEMELLYDKYKNFLYSLAFSYCKNTADAELVKKAVLLLKITNILLLSMKLHL